MNPNIPQGSLPLFGGEYSRATYSDLWAWVQTQTGYLKTEAEWQTLSASNNGNVPYYSSGDGSTTFRVPSLKCWVRGANGTVSEVGSYLEAGLPNITGAFSWSAGNGNISFTSSGAFNASSQATLTAYASTGVAYSGNTGANFDASRSSSIYGNSTTVQPESIVGLWLVKAYGVIVDTGTIDEQAYIDDRFNASKQYTDDEVTGAVNTVNAEISAINTRLGTIYTASGSFVTAGGVYYVCSISTHPAGVFLITGHTSNSIDATSGTMVNYIYKGSTLLWSCVTPCENGGGAVNVIIASLTENEVVTLKGFKPSTLGGTYSGTLTMVQLA